MDLILDNLAVGSAQDGASPPADVGALLCVAAEINTPDAGRPFCKVPIVDMQPIPPAQLQEAVEWIRNHITDHRVLVFCNAGVGRSSSVAVAYLCSVAGFGFGEAVEWVARRHPHMSILPDLIGGVDEVARRLSE
ncbi:MAG: dual specificity protein phosphatase family protein [Gammaproteobacteria bacterium]|nr:dual specificity protein phosphatase family protein [Gammaproteobacteria bacterium]NIR99067.1 dual specificity protein phosphatase family protein [Gammaproteobacteria bacterium]NIT64699.1 dual specificity protein phosphatase family protein [Gammaproteobacteria bacterium]NIV21657.1 hypothetical protein [Gammaproteobacteria bacterium]NIX10619.1 hypothetical protein [Gammaproteobacteria bacterium]